MPNLVVYDTETTTNMVKPENDFNQVIQIASILYDFDLNKKDEFDITCRPLPWSLFSPGALLTNRKVEAFSTDITHYQLILETLDKWRSWSNDVDTIFISYNGDRFDEEVMRRQFYWNLMDPYFTSKDGRSRLDLLVKLYPMNIFYEDSLNIPEINGKKSFKLENIIKSYGIDTADAHDAFTDCLFLYELLALIKNNAPNYFDEIISTTDKNKKIKHLIDNEIHFDCTAFGNKYPVYTFNSENYENQLIASFDLNFDPDDYLNLSYSELEALIFSKGKKKKIIKEVNVRKTTPLVSINTLISDKKSIDNIDKIKANRDKISSNQNFKEKVLDIFANRTFENTPTNIPEQRMYSGGFLTNRDIDVFMKFHNEKNLDEKIRILNTFDDDRYIQFAKRICAQEFPETAPKDYLIHCKNLITERFNDKGPWPDAEKYLNDANKLLENTTDEEDISLLNTSIDHINKNRIN
jgi:exodeoxyribonuclease-1